jgi:predicted dienelactone hydrolase
MSRHAQRIALLSVAATAFIALGLFVTLGAGTSAAELSAKQQQAGFTAQRDPARDYVLASLQYKVETIPDLVLRDTARGKDLHLRVYYPQGPGAYPVIIFSHGAGGDKDVALELLRYWAAHGYVVIAPTHADSIRLRRKEGRQAGMTGILREFGTDADLRISRVIDDSFIIDRLPGLSKLAPELAGKLDASHIGVGGHSAGAMTAMLIGGTTEDMAANGAGGPETADLRDPRVDCVLVLSGQGITRNLSCFDEHSWDGVAIPMMVMTGSLDESARTGQTAVSRCDPYKYAQPGGKYLLFIQGAAHMSFTGKAAGKEGPGKGRLLGSLLGADALDTVQDFDQQAIFTDVQMSSLAFWDACLKGDHAAAKWLQSDAIAKCSGGQVEYSWK